MAGTHRRTHGQRHTPEYKAWADMKQRCENKINNRYDRYGARGIRVCERWRNSFENFLEDVGPRPSPAHSVDRADNDGDYEPKNVRWATPSQQRRNQERFQLIAFGGEEMCLSDWAKRVGIARLTLRRRLVVLGWSVEQALTSPVRRAARRG